MKPGWIPFVALFVAVVPWFFISGNFIYPRFSEYSDLTISHIPNAIFLLESLKAYGEIPYWSGTIMSGYPFTANPLAGIWYLPGWLAYLFPLHLGFNLVVIVHILWGGCGMMRLLKSYGLHPIAVLSGAIAFTAMPKLFAHFAAGHVTLIYAVSWTPWLLLASKFKDETAKKSASHWIFPGAVLGLIGLADIRWLPYAVGLWLVYTAWNVLVNSGGKIIFRRITNWLIVGLVNLGLCMGLSGVVTMGLLEFTPLSTRQAMSTGDVLIYSLPPEELLGFVVPDFGGFSEWVLYPGVVGLLLCVYCMVTPETRKRTWFWLVLLLGAILVSLGDTLPFMRGLADLPGVNLLRVPSRAMFLGGIAVSVIIGFGLDDLLSRGKPSFPDPVFFMVPIMGFVWLLAVGIGIIGGIVPLNMVWAGVFMSITIPIIAMEERNRLPKAFGMILFPLLVMIDLVGSNIQAVEIKTPANVFAKGKLTGEYLERQPGIFRIYTPSNSLPQLSAASLGIEMANGIDPMQLQLYSDFMALASGIDSESYSVTIPPFATGDPKMDNRDAKPDAKLLGLLNVKYLAAEFPIIEEGWVQVERVNGTWIYENLFFRPRSWIQPSAEIQNGEWKEVSILEKRPGKIVVEAKGPGVVVVSEVDFPGWAAMVDGESVQKLRVANLLQGVVIEEGYHRVTFEFTPTTLDFSLPISVSSWLILGVVFIFSIQKKR